MQESPILRPPDAERSIGSRLRGLRCLRGAAVKIIHNHFISKYTPTISIFF